MSDTHYDLIVVGGGIHGLMIGLHATERGLRTLLLDKGDIGGAATAGWFGILHGGLRYLQSLDIRRFRASLSDSRWFLRRYPDLVECQSFLMPLYGHGLKRPGTFRAAFLMERALGADRNRAIPPGKALRRGRILRPSEVRTDAPGVPRDNLQGGALWEELVVSDHAALIDSILRDARAAGLEVRPQTPASDLLLKDGQVAGVATKSVRFLAPRVINAAGAWAPALAHRFDPASQIPFGFPVRAFNLLLDRPPPSTHGLSLGTGDPAEGMLFLRPFQGRTFAGTGYLGHVDTADSVETPPEAITDFLARIDRALPGFDATASTVLAVSSGLLPGPQRGGTALVDRDVIHDHASSGGPKGLVSVWGVKYTTAPSVARHALTLARGDHQA